MEMPVHRSSYGGRTSPCGLGLRSLIIVDMFGRSVVDRCHDFGKTIIRGVTILVSKNKLAPDLELRFGLGLRGRQMPELWFPLAVDHDRCTPRAAQRRAIAIKEGEGVGDLDCRIPLAVRRWFRAPAIIRDRRTIRRRVERKFGQDRSKTIPPFFRRCLIACEARAGRRALSGPWSACRKAY